MSRTREVAHALLALSNHLVSGDDAVDLLSELAVTAVRLLDVSACGVLLADDDRQLHVVAASSDAARAVELLQLHRDEGPCLDCFATGTPVSAPDPASLAATWPAFADAAQRTGVAAVHAFPLRLRDTVLGVMGLFHATPLEMAAADVEIAEALGHVAGIALVAQRMAADQKQLTEQLQHALDSRVVIEQCKGLLAAAGNLDMDGAFRALRKYARDHNSGLTAVARSIVSRELSAERLLVHVRK